jgi:hypothetical protein
MATKILAGVVAALLVTSTGVYVAFSGEATQDTVSETQILSSGSCCTLKAPLACAIIEADQPQQVECVGQACTPDALAACTGSAAMAVSTRACTKGACCSD